MDPCSQAERQVAELKSFDEGWEAALGEFQMRQVIFPESSRGIWKKKFLVVQKRLYFKNFPIGNFSEHIIEVSRDLDLQNIEGSPDLKQLIRAGLKMTK